LHQNFRLEVAALETDISHEPKIIVLRHRQQLVVMMTELHLEVQVLVKTEVHTG
jgi:hypothetical protein